MSGLEARTCRAGEEIVTKGEIGDVMYVVLSGKAAVRIGDLVVREFGIGEMFGELAVIDSQPRSATVFAEEDDTRVLPIDRSRFMYLVSHQPSFALAVMDVLARRLRESTRQAAEPVAVKPPAYVATELQPGLWQFRSNGRACNVYLVEGRDRRILVDTGLGSFYPALEVAMRNAGLAPEGIDQVVLTHEHADHVGGVSQVRGSPGVVAHPLAANKLVLKDDFATVSGVIGEEIEDFAVDATLIEGSVIDVAPYRFDVIHTPGHTSGCVSLIDPEKQIVLSGDTVFAGGAMGGIFGSGNISDYIFSLQRLRRISPRFIFPGHGRASDTGEDDLTIAVKRSETLLRDTRELFKAIGANSAFDSIMNSLKGLNT